MALTGDLSETPFADLVQFYCQKRETVAVMVSTPRGAGTFWIKDGHLIAAELGGEQGLDAVRLAIQLREGSFRVDRNAICPERAIFEPWTKVLLEAAWREDEARTRGIAFTDLARVAGLEGKLDEVVEYLSAARVEGSGVKLPCDEPELKPFQGKAEFDTVCAGGKP